MKEIRFLSVFLCLLTGLFGAVQTVSAENILILPISVDATVDDSSTVKFLYQDAILTANSEAVLMSNDEAALACDNLNCGIKHGERLGAERVFVGSFRKLGSSYFLSVSSQKIGELPKRVTETLQAVEDLPTALPRLLETLENGTEYEQTATVETVTEGEGAAQQLKDTRDYWALYMGGLAPIGASFEYGEEVPSLPLSFHFQYQYAFDASLALALEFGLETHGAMGFDIGVMKYTGEGNISPFFGGRLGLWNAVEFKRNYVDSHGDSLSLEAGSRGYGPALTFEGGVALFRTYRVNLMLRAHYQVIFNTNVDQSVGVELGLAYQSSKSKPAAKEKDSSISWGKYLLFLILISVVAESL